MIIDCHTHLGRNEHIKADVKELLESMDSSKIDKSFVFAGPMNDCPNEWLLKQVKNHRDRLLPVLAYEHHHYRDVDMRELVEKYKVAAIKFYTGYEHFYPLELYDNTGEKPVSSYYYNPLQICADFNIPAIFHSGDCLNSCKQAKLKYAHPLHIDDPATDYPEVNFIIAHMGYPWHRDAAEVCYKNKNVYSDISGFVYKNFDGESLPKFQKTLHEFLEIADSDRLLFGTDWPIANQASYLDALDWVSSHTSNKKMSEVFSAQYMTQNVKKAFKL